MDLLRQEIERKKLLKAKLAEAKDTQDIEKQPAVPETTRAEAGPVLLNEGRKRAASGDDERDDIKRIKSVNVVVESERNENHIKEEKYTSRIASEYMKDSIKFVYKFFRGLLYEWETKIAEHSPSFQVSAEGKEEKKTYENTYSSMKLFFLLCKKKTVPKDILDLSVEIVSHCLQKDYHLAGDAYLRLAIGNAKWPIGVTAVGLHERASRSKVAEGQSHIMADEGTRKYVVAFKRLISLCQTMYPASEPSKMMKS
jgi:pre-mRNA-splicing factor 18